MSMTRLSGKERKKRCEWVSRKGFIHLELLQLDLVAQGDVTRVIHGCFDQSTRNVPLINTQLYLAPTFNGKIWPKI